MIFSEKIAHESIIGKSLAYVWRISRLYRRGILERKWHSFVMPFTLCYSCYTPRSLFMFLYRFGFSITIFPNMHKNSYLCIEERKIEKKHVQSDLFIPYRGYGEVMSQHREKHLMYIKKWLARIQRLTSKLWSRLCFGNWVTTLGVLTRFHVRWTGD